jgi:hypothetical protein
VHVLVVADLTEHIREGFEHSVREIFLPMLIADSFVSGDYTARDCGLTVSTGVWCLPGSVDVRSAGRLSTARPATKQGPVADRYRPPPWLRRLLPVEPFVAVLVQQRRFALGAFEYAPGVAPAARGAPSTGQQTHSAPASPPRRPQSRRGTTCPSTR